MVDQDKKDVMAWTHSEEEDPARHSDSFAEGPFRWYIRSVSMAVRAYDEGFPLRVGKVMGLDILASSEIEEEEAFKAKRDENFEPLDEKQREAEINRRVAQMIRDQDFRGLPERFTFTYQNYKSETLTEDLTRSQIFDISACERVDYVVQEGLVRWEALKPGVPVFDADNPTFSKRNLLLKAKIPVYERIMALSRFGFSESLRAQNR